jgi:hypothetical protein
MLAHRHAQEGQNTFKPFETLAKIRILMEAV